MPPEAFVKYEALKARVEAFYLREQLGQFPG
jgi:hypothetical protein